MDSIVDDTADRAAHVEATSLLVAASRAVEARKPTPLVRDTYAEQFVAAAGGGWADIFRDPGPIDDLLGAGDFGRCFVDYQGARTVLFDKYIGEALQAGITQVVILAAGLDSRGYRLPWPDQTVLYEIDRPGVLEFKQEVLDTLDEHPGTERIIVGADLERGWPTELLSAGFNPSLPTCWLAEGLMMYLTPQAEFALLDHLISLSVPGSRIGLEHADVADVVPENPAGSPQRAEMRDLLVNEDRPHPSPWFIEHGWVAETTWSADLLAELGRPINLNFHTPLETSSFVFATLPAR